MSKTSKSLVPLDSEAVQKLLKKRSWSAHEAGRILLYDAADYLNRFYDRPGEDSKPQIEREAIRRVDRGVRDEEREKYLVYTTLYLSILNSFSTSLAGQTRRSIDSYFMTISFVLTMITAVGSFGLKNKLRNMEETPENVMNVTSSIAQAVALSGLENTASIFTPEGAATKITVNMPTPEEARRRVDESISNFNSPNQAGEMIRAQLSELQARAALLEILSKVYKLPELLTLKYPFNMIKEYNQKQARAVEQIKRVEGRLDEELRELSKELLTDALRPLNSQVFEVSQEKRKATEKEIASLGFSSEAAGRLKVLSFFIEGLKTV